MSEVIFCATDFYLKGGYGSYVDYFRLAELSGYRVIPLSELDPQSDNTYIVTPLNDEWLQGWDKPKARIIHWELEWRIDWRASADTPKGVAETWVSDKAYAQRIGAKYVPMGSHDGLDEAYLHHSEIGTYYDVAQISYQTHRRQIVTQQLQAHNLRLAPNSGLWKSARSTALMQSRVMCHIHQRDDIKGIAPLRWCLAAAHGLPLITESVPDYGIFDYRYMMQARYESIASFTASAIQDANMLQDYSAALHRLLCEEWTFKRSVEANV